MSKQGQSEVMKSRPGEAKMRSFIALKLQALITNDDVDNLSQFAAYQYMRVPGAIDQKTSEVQPSEISESERAHALNPGRFVESGYIYVRDVAAALRGSEDVGIGLAVGEQLLDVTEQTPSIAERILLHAVVWLRRVFFVEVALRESGTVCWRRVSCDMDVRNVMTVT